MSRQKKLINPILDFNEVLKEGETVKLIEPRPEWGLEVKPNTYYITSTGRIFSGTNWNGRGWRQMQPHELRDGYEQIRLKNNDSSKRDKEYRISRLVGMHFLEVPDNVKEMEINHKDFDIHNNDANNLEWMTHNENIEYSALNGGYAGFTKQNVIDIVGLLNEGKTATEIAKIYGVSYPTIAGIRDGKRYTDITDSLEKNYAAKQHFLTDDEIVEIYRLSSIQIDDEGLAKKFNVSPATICYIRNLTHERYRKVLKGYTPIAKDITKIPDTIVHYVRNECLKGTPTAVVARMYNISDPTVTDIKYARGRFAYLRNGLGYQDIAFQAGRVLYPQEAYDIYEYIKNNHPQISEAASKFGVGKNTIMDIKYCRNSYLFLATQYGCTPIVG